MSSLNVNSLAKLNAQAVIEMFADLGLPVCNDARAIRGKVLEQRDRRLHDKNSPDRDVAHRANVWFKNVDALENRRADLLALVYQLFVSLADAAIKASGISDVAILTPDLKDGLRNVALTSCRVDLQTAEQFLATYSTERHLTDAPISTGFIPQWLKVSIASIFLAGAMVLGLQYWKRPFKFETSTDLSTQDVMRPTNHGINEKAQLEQAIEKIRRLEAEKEDLENRLVLTIVLTNELQRVQGQKVALEREPNELTAIRNQVPKLKQELAVAPWLELIRKGLFGNTDDQGTERLLLSSTNFPPDSGPIRKIQFGLNPTNFVLALAQPVARSHQSNVVRLSETVVNSLRDTQRPPLSALGLE